MTAKVSKKKLLLAAIAIVGLIVLLSMLLKGRDGKLPANALDENGERIAFLSSYGYTVNGEPTETQSISIPTEASEVFDRYNALQKSQGYDLTQYAGQSVTRYVYALEGYDDTGAQWYATLLVADGEIIGGDIASGEPGGQMHGFERPATHSAPPSDPAASEVS